MKIKYPTSKEINKHIEAETFKLEREYVSHAQRANIDAEMVAYEDGIKWVIKKIKALNKR